jgi:DNA-binding beta-propeller fold protein YncE
VLKLAAGSNTQTALPFTGLDLCDNNVDAAIAGVAADAAGNVYVSDSCHNRVVELPAGSNTQTVLPFKGLDSPQGVAVDSNGTVYVVDYSGGQVLKLAAGSSKQTPLPSPGKGITPDGNVAVDTAGNVYVGFSKSHYKRRSESYLLKLAPGSNSWTTVTSAPDNFGASFSTGEQDLAVDPAGNLYAITSTDTQGVWKLAPGSDTWTPLQGAPPLMDPLGLAVDTRGHVYVTDHLGSRATGAGLPWEDDDAHGFVLKLPAG